MERYGHHRPEHHNYKSAAVTLSQRGFFGDKPSREWHLQRDIRHGNIYGEKEREGDQRHVLPGVEVR